MQLLQSASYWNLVKIFGCSSASVRFCGMFGSVSACSRDSELFKYHENKTSRIMMFREIFEADFDEDVAKLFAPDFYLHFFLIDFMSHFPYPRSGSAMSAKQMYSGEGKALCFRASEETIEIIKSQSVVCVKIPTRCPCMQR
jgi:hypothetical protein